MKYSQIEDLRNQIIKEFKNYILHKIPRDFLNKEFDIFGDFDKIRTCKITEVISDSRLKMSFDNEKPEVFLIRFFDAGYIGAIDSFAEKFIYIDNDIVKNIKNWRESIIAFFNEQPVRVLSKQYTLKNGYNTIDVSSIIQIGIIDKSGFIYEWDCLDCYQLEQLLNYYMYDYYTMKE